MELKTICHFILILVYIHSIICDEIRLDQMEPQIKRPGETFKISCKVSGFDMTSYWMHWIRQKPGKPLEWIGEMNSGSNSATCAASLKDQFIMTEDVSLSTQYLQAKSLRAEDTAVYYCARRATVTQETEVPNKNFLCCIVGDEIRLDQTEPQIRRSGETFKISFFTLSSYWIRLKPGKPLEWIGSINGGTSYYSEALKYQFIVTDEISWSTTYLEAKSLRAEDNRGALLCSRD
ncbi:uncharacterized protein LOC114784180 [Denticeps clupeoides]|uniref:uncharacterized protein LOC114784180 n=1 Tax=Denticeps clupeoides TaxID=299321 RepID=UPI0010A3194E|nr:uncharacterized protein LOC114784180 [Denticeps clupeoides]